MYIDRIEADQFYLAIECNYQKHSKTSLMVNVAFCIWWKQNLQNSFKLYFFLYQANQMNNIRIACLNDKINI